MCLHVYLCMYLSVYLCVPACVSTYVNVCVCTHTIIFGVTIIFYKLLRDLDQNFLEGRVREWG